MSDRRSPILDHLHGWSARREGLPRDARNSAAWLDGWDSGETKPDVAPSEPFTMKSLDFPKIGGSSHE